MCFEINLLVFAFFLILLHNILKLKGTGVFTNSICMCYAFLIELLISKITQHSTVSSLKFVFIREKKTIKSNLVVNFRSKEIEFIVVHALTVYNILLMMSAIRSNLLLLIYFGKLYALIQNKCRTLYCYRLHRPSSKLFIDFFLFSFFQFGNEAWKDWWFVRMLTALNSSAWNVWNILLCSYLNIVWANDFFNCLMPMSYFSSSMIEWMLWIFCVQNEREPDGTDRKGKRAEIAYTSNATD